MANDKKLVSLTVPEIDPYFYIDKELRVILDRMENLSRKHPINILVSGKQGCGKSSLVSQFGAVYNRPTAHFQIGILSEPGQLFGEQTLKNGETSYRPYLFPEALQTPQSIKPEISYYSEKCIGCGRCAERCPTGATYTEVKGQGAVLRYDRSKCIGCGKCVEACLSGARDYAGRKMPMKEIVREATADAMFFSIPAGV